MQLKKIITPLTVCKIDNVKDINFNGKFVFVGKTETEISLVCETEYTPINTIEREDGWLGFGIVGQLDFSLIGIIAKISDILAKQNIGIFVISTYDTDYVLVKSQNYDKALKALETAGYQIID